ncbi:EAL domain-containing protein [Marinobacter orientalis]|uniref:EAL domain-containing protein n=1 Tax=Marinobacter orientalis TaxID=1928859 RepID=A0A7Y0REJ7_9GAMM|nr:EAL domain-containing protein [Marinobacter orientalis]NMT64771.1 EAL domain-containing protein [Marinobacter orientalis]TGX48762.1 EAL domain-containing protein [Marinobacter orientalis]
MIKLVQLIQSEMEQLPEDWQEAALDINGNRGSDHVIQALPIAHLVQELRRRVIRASIAQSEAERLLLSRELDDALREDQLEVYYLPVIDISTGTIARAEALLRWNHPYKGLLTPAAFLGIAQQNGMANCITLDVLEQSITCSNRWRDLSDKAFPININESPASFVTPDLMDQWRARLTEIGLSGSHISLELSPTSLNNIHACAFNPVRSLGLAGLRLHLAIDQLGTEPSAFEGLQEFKADCVKVDRELINDAAQGGDSDRILESTIAIAHAIDAQVVAEGVENDEQLQYLSRCGCDYAQGFQVSMPLRQDDFEVLLERNRQKETA